MLSILLLVGAASSFANPGARTLGILTRQVCAKRCVSIRIHDQCSLLVYEVSGERGRGERGQRENQEEEEAMEQDELEYEDEDDEEDEESEQEGGIAKRRKEHDRISR